jgi:hypothetical protein
MVAVWWLKTFGKNRENAKKMWEMDEMLSKMRILL